MEQIPGPRKKWMIRAGVGFGVVGVLAISAPIIWSAASAGAGLIALGVIGAVGVGFMQALPMLGQKWENKILALQKAEARANPIEQLQSFWLAKASRVTIFKQAVVKIGAQIKGMEEMLRERKRTKPNYDASKQEADLATMKEAHQVLLVKYQNAEIALGQLKEIIDDKKFEWSFGQAGQQAVAQLNAANGEDLLNQVLADEAFTAVRDNFNQVFAELEVEVERLVNTPQLANTEPITLDLDSVPDKITVKR